MGFSWQRASFSPTKRQPHLTAHIRVPESVGFWQRCRARVDAMMNGWDRPRMTDRR